MERFMSFNQGRDDTIEPAYMKNFSGSNNGQSELPAVTIEDNNKVLTVVNGEWDKADLSGGNEPFIISIGGDSTSGHTLDKTNAEILVAFKTNPTNIFIRYGWRYNRVQSAMEFLEAGDGCQLKASNVEIGNNGAAADCNYYEITILSPTIAPDIRCYTVPLTVVQ